MTILQFLNAVLNLGQLMKMAQYTVMAKLEWTPSYFSIYY